MPDEAVYEADQSKRDGSQLVVEATVDSIRRELRSAMFDCCFWGKGLAEVLADKEAGKTARDGLFLLLQFGVRAGLLCPNEGNDWMAVMNGKMLLPDVAEKWMPAFQGDRPC